MPETVTTPMCQELQMRFLDAGPARVALSADEAQHLADCPACREVAEGAGTLSNLLETLGAEMRTLVAEPAERADAVKSRVLARIKSNLGNLSEAQTVAALKAKRAQVAAPEKLNFGQKLAALFGQRNVFWLGTAATCGLLVWAGVALWQYSQPVGELTFAQADDLRLVGGSVDKNGQHQLMRGTKVATGKGGAMAEIGGTGEIMLAMNSDCELVVTGDRELRLNKGSIWLQVKEKGRGFRVRTDIGTVIVTGTIFGVSTTSGELSVDVTRGHVNVQGAQDVHGVGAGEYLAATQDQLGNAEPRKDGTALPSWVESLGAAADKARVRSYVPSVGTVGPAISSGGTPAASAAP